MFKLLILSALSIEIHVVHSFDVKTKFTSFLPETYKFIAKNAYICSSFQLEDGSIVTFLTEENGLTCKACNEHNSFGFACGKRKMGNETDEVACFEVPPLCIKAFELLYGKKEHEHLHESSLKLNNSSFSIISKKSTKKRTVVSDEMQKKQTNVEKNVHKSMHHSIIAKREKFIGTTSTTLKPQPIKKACEDKDQLCCFWATTGECNRNPFWMKINCAKTCGTCDCARDADKCISRGIHCELPSTTQKPRLSTDLLITTVKPTSSLPLTKTTRRRHTRPFTPPVNGFRRTKVTNYNKIIEFQKTTTKLIKKTEYFTTTSPTSTTENVCKDYHNECSFWADLGECRSNPFYMLPQCQRACKSCGEEVNTVFAPTPRPGCDNGNKLCNYWAHIGECFSNANFMLSNCRLACRVC